MYALNKVSEESLPSGILRVSRLCHMTAVRINVSTNWYEMYGGITQQNVTLYKFMDIKFEQGSYYNSSSSFLFICWWRFCPFKLVSITKTSLVFIEQIYTKHLFGRLKTCHVFLLSLWLANERTISCIDTCLDTLCASPFTFEPKSKYPRTRTKNALLGTTWKFYLHIKFQCRFQRQDQHQRSSLIDNKMLHSEGSFINFHFQS